MLSQNDTTDGWRTLSVDNWSVNGPAGLGTGAGGQADGLGCSGR